MIALSKKQEDAQFHTLRIRHFRLQLWRVFQDPETRGSDTYWNKLQVVILRSGTFVSVVLCRGLNVLNLDLIICYTFFKFVADTCPFWGPLVPLFWISGDISSRFQSQSGFCLIPFFVKGKYNVALHSLRSTSDATPANLLMPGIAAGHFPHKHQQRWDLAWI